MKTTLVRIIKVCIHGEVGDVVRLKYRDAIRACEKGVALMHEWKPPQRGPVVDVQKVVADGNP